MSILVTGGAGFIGSHLVDALIENGKDVVVVDNLFTGFKENINPKALFLVESVGDFCKYGGFNHHHIETIYHLAAYAAEGLSHHVPTLNCDTNITQSIALITEAVRHGVKHFIFASSAAVYGSHDECKSDSYPMDPYGVAKRTIEMYLKTTHLYHGMDYSVLRFHNVYGPRQNIWDPYRNVVGIFIRQCLEGEPMTIFGDGNQTRNFTYISDVIRDLMELGTTAKPLNSWLDSGNPRPVSIKKLAAMIGGHFDKFEIQSIGERKEASSANPYSGDGYLPLDKIDMSECVSLENGIPIFIDWARAQKPRENPLPIRIELAKNIPQAWA